MYFCTDLSAGVEREFAPTSRSIVANAVRRFRCETLLTAHCRRDPVREGNNPAWAIALSPAEERRDVKELSLSTDRHRTRNETRRT